LSIITNRELRDLWADAAKIKEAISGGKVAVADAAVLAKLEAMRVLLAGTLSTADAAVLAKLADLESKLDMILNGTTPATVKLTGSKVQVDTLLNSVSIPAGGNQVFNINPTSEDEIWVLISIDKQPWLLAGSSLIYSSSDGGTNMFYPVRTGVSTTHNIYNPCVSLCLGGLNLATSWGLTPPTSMTEARQYMITPYQADLKGRLVNNSSEVATATVKVVRVWKKG